MVNESIADVFRRFHKVFCVLSFVESVSYYKISLLCCFSCRFALVSFFFLDVGCVASFVVIVCACVWGIFWNLFRYVWCGGDVVCFGEVRVFAFFSIFWFSCYLCVNFYIFISLSNFS